MHSMHQTGMNKSTLRYLLRFTWGFYICSFMSCSIWMVQTMLCVPQYAGTLCNMCNMCTMCFGSHVCKDTVLIVSWYYNSSVIKRIHVCLHCVGSAVFHAWWSSLLKCDTLSHECSLFNIWEHVCQVCILALVNYLKPETCPTPSRIHIEYCLI